MTSRCHAAIYYPALFIIAGAGLSLLCRDIRAVRLALTKRQASITEAAIWPTAAVLVAFIAIWNIGIFASKTGPTLQAEARGVQSVIAHIQQSYKAERTVIVQSDKRMFFYAVEYYLPEYRGYQLEQTLLPSRPSLATPSPIKLEAEVDTVVFLNPDARVAGDSERIALAEGFAVRVKRLRPHHRYMHFSPAGVAFWASPHLPGALAEYGTAPSGQK